MQWEELVEKAKELDGFIASASTLDPERIFLDSLVYYKNGRVCLDDTDEDGGCCVMHFLAIDRTPKQMLMIMEALK